MAEMDFSLFSLRIGYLHSLHVRFIEFSLDGIFEGERSLVPTT